MSSIVTTSAVQINKVPILAIGSLIGTRVYYVQATPSGLSPVRTTGTIIAVDPTTHQLHIRPDAPNRLTKWRAFDDVLFFLAPVVRS